MPFWNFVGTFLVSFWRHFARQISSLEVLRFRARPVELPGTTTGSKKLIFIGLLLKIEGRPFRVGVLTGAVLEAKMELKWTPKSAKKLLKTNLENRSEIRPQKWIKIEPKSIPNCTQSRIKNRFEIYTFFSSWKNDGESYGGVPENM